MIYNILRQKFTEPWEDVFEYFLNQCDIYDDYYECINFNYKISPYSGMFMSKFEDVLDLEKAKAVYEWYRNKDSRDHSIENYFDEYKHCTDKDHLDFNSNYGLYAYSEEGLDKCIKYLIKDPMTRQAMFCINNNEAMSERSIDKLCTNTVQFFIRNNSLKMIVQMRSSNFLTLLPYDSMMFCYWYFYVYDTLRKNGMKTLNTDFIYFNVASLHMYKEKAESLNVKSKKYNAEELFDFYKNYNYKNIIKSINNE